MICIHEVRDLHMEDGSTPPDPVVFVEMFNHKFHTRVMEGCRSCKFEKR
jgi:hypothetical protein